VVAWAWSTSSIAEAAAAGVVKMTDSPVTFRLTLYFHIPHLLAAAEWVKLDTEQEPPGLCCDEEGGSDVRMPRFESLLTAHLLSPRRSFSICTMEVWSHGCPGASKESADEILGRV
jgi:hypothetical protein